MRKLAFAISGVPDQTVRTHSLVKASTDRLQTPTSVMVKV